MTSELFPLPAIAHRTFTRVVPLPWPHTGYAYRSECRGCAWNGPHLRSTVTGAYEDGYRHRRFVADTAGLPKPPADLGLDETPPTT